MITAAASTISATVANSNASYVVFSTLLIACEAFPLKAEVDKVAFTFAKTTIPTINNTPDTTSVAISSLIPKP